MTTAPTDDYESDESPLLGHLMCAKEMPPTPGAIAFCGTVLRGIFNPDSIFCDVCDHVYATRHRPTCPECRALDERLTAGEDS